MDRGSVTEVDTDCRTEEGVTVGLVDALITTARVLARRDLTPPPVVAALADLRDDEDLRLLLAGYERDHGPKWTGHAVSHVLNRCTCGATWDADVMVCPQADRSLPKGVGGQGSHGPDPLAADPARARFSLDA